MFPTNILLVVKISVSRCALNKPQLWRRFCGVFSIKLHPCFEFRTCRPLRSANADLGRALHSMFPCQQPSGCYLSFISVHHKFSELGKLEKSNSKSFKLVNYLGFSQIKSKSPALILQFATVLEKQNLAKMSHPGSQCPLCDRKKDNFP